MSVRENPRLHEVDVQAIDAARLEPLIGTERMSRFEQAAEAARETLAGSSVLNVNSTASRRRRRRAAADVARLRARRGHRRAMAGDRRGPRVLRHHEADPQPPVRLARRRRRPRRRRARRATSASSSATRTSSWPSCAPATSSSCTTRRPPASSAVAKHAGARVVWRCHVGRDRPERMDATARWEFLGRTSTRPMRSSFTRRTFAPPMARSGGSSHVITPSIDPFSPKNEPLDTECPLDALRTSGSSTADRARRPPALPPPGRVARSGRPAASTSVQTGPPPPPDVPLVVQVSRWDRMKDMPGVLSGFADHVDPSFGAHLVLAGPTVHGVADDPEGAAVLDECIDAWRRPPPRRSQPRPPRVPPDARPRRERVDRERAPASRYRRHPEEPRGGLRPHGRGGDVEGERRSSPARSAASSTRSRTACTACSWPIPRTCEPSAPPWRRS